MLQDVIKERIELIERMSRTFREVVQPTLPDRFRRGEVQRIILKLHNLPRTGPNMRAINEAIESYGYKKFYLLGICSFKKIGTNGKSR